MILASLFEFAADDGSRLVVHAFIDEAVFDPGRIVKRRAGEGHETAHAGTRDAGGVDVPRRRLIENDDDTIATFEFLLVLVIRHDLHRPAVVGLEERWEGLALLLGGETTFGPEFLDRELQGAGFGDFLGGRAKTDVFREG